ncbi:MAG: response regulator [Elainellaceae cyanobacterium]
MKILLVEDDQPTAAVLSELLVAQHYTIDVVADGQVGLSFATTWTYDLILLDLLIPKLGGIDLCRQLRAQGYQKPILLLTAKDTSADVVKGLDAGADDYVTKPYNLSELLARIRALLRRGDTSLAPSVLTWEHLCLNPVSAEVTYRGQPLALTPKEYAIVGLFLRHPHRIFSRSDIIDRLWSIDACPGEGAVTNLIKDLRQKLKAAGITADLLETVYGLGYRLRTPPQTAELPDPQNQPIERTKKKPSQENIAAVNRVLERYRSTFTERVGVLEQVEQALQTKTLSQNLLETAIGEAHKLAGALGSFGYATGSKLAQAIEHLLLRHPHLSSSDIALLSNLIADLKQALASPPAPLNAQPFEPAQLPLVLVIDQDASFTQQLQQDALAWGLRVEVASDLKPDYQQILKTNPQAVLLSWQETGNAQLTLLQTLQEKLPTVPVLVMTGQDSLTDRVTVSRLGIKRFLHKPTTTTAVFEAIAPVLPKSAMAAAKVMVLDDDPVMLAMVHDLLQPWGLQVQTLQDPKQFWEMLIATSPDLLVMDLEMPTFSGIDLCRVVRQDPKWGNLPILVVTAHTHMKSIQQVFAAGADDFIGKPIVGPELVTRVISRIDRSRLQQELETMKRRIGT